MTANHDRIHAKKPAHHVDRWSVGTIESIGQRDGHCVIEVTPEDGDAIELVVTMAVRDLFLGRLDIADGESPIGEQVWFREHGASG